MKNLKITLSIATLFIASHTVQATELQEQNAPTNQEALYQLELRSIEQPELIRISPLCGDYPACDSNISNVNQPLPTLSTQE